MYYFKDKEKIPVAALDTYTFSGFDDNYNSIILNFSRNNEILNFKFNTDDGMSIKQFKATVDKQGFTIVEENTNNLVLSRKDKSYIAAILHSIGYKKRINFERI